MSAIDKKNLPLLSILFISYKRYDLLLQTYKSLLEHVNYKPVELVVADDGSDAETQKKIKGLFFDQYILNEKNKGLGANNNSGLMGCSGKYILMLQDDWEMQECPSMINNAIAVLENDLSIAMVRFYGSPYIFPSEERQIGNINYIVVNHKSLQYKPFPHVYSDTPHIRRRELNFDQEIGLYKEGFSMEETEQEFIERFDNQDKYKIAFMEPNFQNKFKHIGAEKSFRTNKFRYKLDNALLIIIFLFKINKNNNIYIEMRKIYFWIRKKLITFKIIK